MTAVIYHLRGVDADLVAAWQKYFAGIPEVRPAVGDIFGEKIDAIVSPANCFGDLSGGIDRLYSKRFGPVLQQRLQAVLRDDYDGELPIGLAVLVETGDAEVPYLISAPTMRVPLNISQTVNPYLAFRAVLRLVQKTNRLRPGTIGAVACPGLGTGTGEVPPLVCAKQMHAAYEQVVGGRPWRPADLNEALVEHYRLLRTDD